MSKRYTIKLNLIADRCELYACFSLVVYRDHFIYFVRSENTNIGGAQLCIAKT